VTKGPKEVDRVGDLREVLTATGAGLYLANHVAGPIPAETVAAVHESDDLELRIGRAGPDRNDDLDQREKEARAVVAAVIKASPEHVALSHGAADGVRLAMLDLVAHRPADDRRRVLCQASIEPRVAAAVAGVAAAAGWSVDTVEAIPDVIAADVALVAVAHVDRDGRRADLRRIASASTAAGARTLVDASLSLGAAPLDVTEVGLDIVVADGHRWLLGPEGTALTWVSPDVDAAAAERLRHATGGFGRGALLGLARSVGWLLMYIELPWVVARTETLADRLYGALSAIDGVSVVASDDHGAVAAFSIDDWHADEAAEELSRGVFAIVEFDTDADLVRASVGAWNREQEIDRFVERVAELAAHTPETLPRKPSLTVLTSPIDTDP
jgi:selenocysteine lyase/cysteine desulfurase